MANILPQAETQFVDGNGKPYAGGFVYFYIPSTTTFKNTWKDAAQTILNTNPIVLDGDGRAIIFGSGAYRQQLYDVNNNLIWDQLTYSTATTTDLSDTGVPGGAGLIGFDGTTLAQFFLSKNCREVDSIAALRTLAKTTYTRAFAMGYYTAGDGGGGFYWYDPSDTTSTDNGGTIIVAADGGRWKLEQNTAISIKQFGAKGDGVASDSTAIQAAINSTAGQLFVPDGTYLLNATLELKDNLIITCSKGSKFIPSANSMTMIKASTHAYFSQIRSATLDGNTKTGITGFDLTNFRLQAGLYDCQITNMTNGAIMRTGCFGAVLDNFTSYNGVPNAITVTENCAVLDIRNPRIDNETGTGAGTGNGIAIQAVGVPNEGVRITGGYIQGFQYGILDNGLGTRISETYFEQCTLGDVFFNAARNSSARDTQHFAAVGAAAFKGRNCDGITIFNPDMSSGGRTVLYDFDATNTDCNEYRAGSNAGYNTPTGSLAFLNRIGQQVIQTFTPTVAGSGTTGTGTYSAQTGTATYLGSQVHIQIVVAWTAHTGTGNIVVKGIPAGLAPASFTPRRIAQLGMSGISFTGPMTYAYLNGNGTDMSLLQVSTAGAESLIALGATGTIYINLIYDL